MLDQEAVLNRLQNIEKALTGQQPEMHQKVGNANAAQLLYADGGLFTDLKLERPVLNTLIQPMYSLANAIPVKRTTIEKQHFAFLTDLAAAGTTPQDYPCDDPPQVGGIDALFAQFDIGRIEYSTQTLEKDVLIRRASRGDLTSIYLVGDIRGVSADPNGRTLTSSEVLSGAVRYQMHRVGRAIQMTHLDWFWTGDPASATQNGDHGGWKSTYGLNHYIANNYANAVAKPWVTGTGTKTKLNSLIVDFTNSGAQDGIIGGGESKLYPYLQFVESRLHNRASRMGLLPVMWYCVMRPEVWDMVTRYLPCEMVGDSCNGGAVINANDGANGMYNMMMRQQLVNTRTLELNGRRTMVVLDDALPYTDNGNDSITSSIKWVPMTVAGGYEVLYWRHMDYTQFGSELASLPNNQSDMLGWSDSGRYDWVIQMGKGRCFEIRCKTETALVFLAPHLAASIDNVTVTDLDAFEIPGIAA